MASPEEHERASRVLAIPQPYPDEPETSAFDLLKLEDPRYLRERARLYTPSAMDTLVGIMEDPSQPASARSKVAELLLAYGWGKPSSQAEIAKLFIDYEDGKKIIEFEMPMTVDSVKDDNQDGRARPQDL